MIIRRVLLENIRSYVSSTIELPEGTVLLAGDIGSGKSTVLLAIDFALFGLQKDLSGASLLRHGKDSGSVEMEFSVSEKTYIIRRSLVRKGGSVRQAAGHIIVDGIKKDLTAQELKSYILSLLGYPEQALRRDSALIYRFTVYTPQEQMKQIIEAAAEERLDIIRRLFGLDKYKRISENAQTYAKELRGTIRELSGQLSDLSLKQKERRELLERIALDEKQFLGVQKELETKKAQTTSLRESILAIEKDIERLQEKKEAYSKAKTEFDLTKNELEMLTQEKKEADDAVASLSEELSKKKAPKEPETKHSLGELRALLDRLRVEQQTLHSRKAVLSKDLLSLASILEKGLCTVCQQEVADRDAFSKKIAAKKEEEEKIDKRLVEISAESKKTDEAIETLQRLKDYRNETLAIKERLADRQERAKDLESKIKKKKALAKALAEEVNKIARQIKGDTTRDKYATMKKELDAKLEEKESTQSKYATISQKIADSKERLVGLEKEIDNRLLAKRQMNAYVLYEHWLRDVFVKLMGTIERHVMLSIQQAFDDLFGRWFATLVPDDGLSARISDDFSVILEQNGYLTDYTFMSGGERTAVALAYRLALNRVINDLTESIRTRDLIILDEPTDGFSSEQMDSVRDVLAELATRQTIIVSHEPRLEGFMDESIRFVKENHISRVEVSI